MQLLRAQKAGTLFRSALVALAGITVPVLAQAQGTITGRITSAASNEPLSDVRIAVVGSPIAVLSGADGRYTLRGVPAGTPEVRVLRVGFTEQKKAIAVSTGASVTLDFAMAQAVVQLQEIVTTATGEQRRVELGNSVGVINVAAAVETAPIKNMGDLLTAKAPGVQVMPGVMTGAGARVRVRGTASLSLSNDPIYVIDGIRMTSDNSGAAQAIGVGGTAASRVSDLNPEEIENIEIVKGPSAATLYGTDAANGVIVITTKRGRAGAARWNVFGEQGVLQDRNTYPTQYAILGHPKDTLGVTRRCLLKQISLGTCIKDSTTSLNLFEDPLETPIKDGWRNELGAQVSGGTDAVRYFVSGGFENEIGTLGMPDYDAHRLDSIGIAPVRGEQARPNALQKASVRVNATAVVNPTLDLSLQSGFIKLDQRLPQVDNNVNSFLYNAFTGPGFKSPGPGYLGVGSLGQPLNGWSGFTPGDIFQQLTTQGVNRYIGSGNANWRPFTWMQNRADVGLDYSARAEYNLCRQAQCSDFGTNRAGFATDSRTGVRNFTANLSSTGQWQVLPSTNLKTTAGAQYVNYASTRVNGTGSTLPPGATQPSSGATPSVQSATTLTKTVGVFVEEQAALRDRLFLTAAVRTDQNSAFGTNFQRVYYPKGSVSWLLSDESFFPHYRFLDQFRFRASMGSAGVQPGANDAARFFQVNTINIAGTDVPTERSAALGNTNLRPERSTELETGFDMKMFQNRVSAELTYYYKSSKDALIDKVIAPSAGSATSTLKMNLGSVLNTGFEGLITAQLIDRREFGWNVTLNGSHNSNKLVSLGVDPVTGKPIPPIINTNTRQIEGYPINGWWQHPFSWSDKNNDGFITPTEVAVDSKFVYMGYSQPRDEVSIQSGVDLFGRRLHISGLIDYKGGYTIQNREQLFLAGNAVSYSGTSDLNASLQQQARTIAARDGIGPDSLPLLTNAGFFENGRFWRIREVSAVLDFPDRYAQRYLRAQGGSIVFAARNLGTFTKFTGTDPEANFSQGDLSDNLLTLAPPTYFTFRLNLRY